MLVAASNGGARGGGGSRIPDEGDDEGDEDVSGGGVGGWNESYCWHQFNGCGSAVTYKVKVPLCRCTKLGSGESLY